MKLTKLWKEIVKLPRKDRNLKLIELIFSHKIFKEIYHKFTKEKSVKKEDVVKIMKESNLYKVNSNKTYNRRASTITWWCKWIKKTLNEEK